MPPKYHFLIYFSELIIKIDLKKKHNNRTVQVTNRICFIIFY